MKKVYLSVIAAILGLVATTGAFAHDSVGFSVSFGAPAYYTAPPVYYAPPQVYYPRTQVYYTPQPVYYGQYSAPRYRHDYNEDHHEWHHHHRHGDDD